MHCIEGFVVSLTGQGVKADLRGFSLVCVPCKCRSREEHWQRDQHQACGPARRHEMLESA